MASFEKQPISGTEHEKDTAEVRGEMAGADHQEKPSQVIEDSPKAIEEAAAAQAEADKERVEEILDDIKEGSEKDARSESGEEIIGKIKSVEAEMDRLRGEMGFREKFLNGQFGGDAAKPKQLRRLQKEFSALEEQFGEHLRTHDPVYQELVRPYDAVVAMKAKVDAFYSQIEEMIPKEEPNNGRTVATTLIGINFGFKAAVAYNVLSELSSDQASPSKRKFNAGIQRSMKALQQDISDYTEFVRGYEFPTVDGIDPRALESALDLVVRGKMFSASDIREVALSMDEDMDEDSLHYPSISLKAREIQGVVSKQVRKMEEITQQYARAARKTAN